MSNNPYFRYGELPHLGKHGEMAMQQVMQQEVAIGNFNSSGTDFDINFSDILDDPEGLNSFTAHLIREFAIESIAFWKECQLYKNIDSSNEAALRTKAMHLLTEYVQESSPNQVNLPR